MHVPSHSILSMCHSHVRSSLILNLKLFCMVLDWCLCYRLFAAISSRNAKTLFHEILLSVEFSCLRKKTLGEIIPQ
uniref:BZIP domain-containing protein n=1 Tax=Parascaris univalens TaxID=6257 RepID=A0A914ZEI3_PARUN